MTVGVAGGWLPTTASGAVVPVRTSAARVVAADPGAFLDGEPWTFAITFTDPDTGNPTDLTGSRLYANLSLSQIGGFEVIQVLDSDADDGSIVIAPGATGLATFTASPEGRTWTAPQFGLMPVRLPVFVIADVYRQIGDGDPVGLTTVTLRILPSTGRPLPPLPPPASSKLDFSTGQSTALVALFPLGMPTNVAPPAPVGVVDFSNSTNSGLISLLPFGAA